MNDIKRLAGYIGSYKKDMMLGALMVMIETAFELVIPIMIAGPDRCRGSKPRSCLYLFQGLSNGDLCTFGSGDGASVCTVCSEGFLWMGSEDQGGRICKSDAVFFLKSGSF